MGERTGLSLSAALRNKNKKQQQPRGGKGAFILKKRGGSSALSTPAPLVTDLPELLPASASSDTSDSITATTNTPTSFDSFDHDITPTGNDSAAASFTPLSDIHAQELFLSPLDEAILVQRKTVRFNLSFSPEVDEKKRSLQEEEEKEPEEESLAIQLPQPQILCLSSLLNISPPSLETIVEGSNEEDTLSVSSSASSSTEFHVSFSPSNDLFLRTLAMERAAALSMSELSIKAASVYRDDFSVNDSSILYQYLQHYQHFSLNQRLGLMILLLLLLHCTGTSQLVIRSLQSVPRQLWMALWNLLHKSETDTCPVPFLYDIHNEPVGVWLR